MKTELEKLIAQMEACNGEIAGAVAKSKSAKTEEEKGQWTAVMKAKTAQFAELKADYESLKARVEAEKVVAEAKSLSLPDFEGRDANPGTVKQSMRQTTASPGPLGTERVRLEAFAKYMTNGGFRRLSDNEANLIISKSRSGDQEDAVALPACIAKAITAATPAEAARAFKSYMDAIFGKDSNPLLSTDSTGGATDSGVANLRPATLYIPEVFQEPVFMPSIVDRVRRVPAGAGNYTYPKLDQTQGKFGGVAFTWKASEGLDKGETTPTFGSITGTTTELSGWTDISLIALRRSVVDLAAFLVVLFRNAVNYELSSKIIHGSGTNQPRGILNGVGLITVPRQAAGNVSYADLVNLEFSLKKGFRNGALYLVEDSAEKHLKAQMNVPEDKPVFAMSANVGMGTTLAGYPYDVHDFTDAAGDALVSLGDEGDVIFGNLQNYWLGIEDDIAIASSEGPEFKKGLVTYRLMMLAGGQPAVGSAFAALTAQGA
mgnify:FL=1